MLHETQQVKSAARHLSHCPSNMDNTGVVEAFEGIEDDKSKSFQVHPKSSLSVAANHSHQQGGGVGVGDHTLKHASSRSSSSSLSPRDNKTSGSANKYVRKSSSTAGHSMGSVSYPPLSHTVDLSSHKDHPSQDSNNSSNGVNHRKQSHAKVTLHRASTVDVALPAHKVKPSSDSSHSRRADHYGTQSSLVVADF